MENENKTPMKDANKMKIGFDTYSAHFIMVHGLLLCLKHKSDSSPITLIDRDLIPGQLNKVFQTR